MYAQRNNFHRKNRRVVRFGPGSQGQFDQAAYLHCLGLDWERNNYTTTANDAIINHMTVPLPNHPIPTIPPGIVSSRHGEETEDQDVKIVLVNMFERYNYLSRGRMDNLNVCVLLGRSCGEEEQTQETDVPELSQQAVE